MFETKVILLTDQDFVLAFILLLSFASLALKRSSNISNRRYETNIFTCKTGRTNHRIGVKASPL